MAPFATLETERLFLRPFTEDDAAVFYELGTHPDVVRFTGDGGMKTVEEALAVMRAHPLADYAKYGFGRWACVLKAAGKVIGFAGLKYLDDLREVDVGYRLLPAYWGGGLATEAAVASVDFGFEQLGLETIIGLVDPENFRSVRVLEKAGLTFDGLVAFRSQKVARYVIGREAFDRRRAGEA